MRPCICSLARPPARPPVRPPVRTLVRPRRACFVQPLLLSGWQPALTLRNERGPETLSIFAGAEKAADKHIYVLALLHPHLLVSPYVRPTARALVCPSAPPSACPSVRSPGNPSARPCARASVRSPARRPDHPSARPSAPSSVRPIVSCNNVHHPASSSIIIQDHPSASIFIHHHPSSIIVHL